MSRYLNEIRLGEEKQQFRDIIKDVRREFDLTSRKRPVPHISLFGPYNTQQGLEVKKRTQRVLSDYRVAPFQVTGFGAFSDSKVVYAVVEPSKQLRALRRDLADSLESVTYDYRPWDLDDSYEFHISIATNLGQELSPVLWYVRSEYDLDMTLYATRISALDRREMMWEWDLPRSVELSSQRATSKESWEKTMDALNRRKEQTEGELPKQTTEKNLLSRILQWRP